MSDTTNRRSYPIRATILTVMLSMLLTLSGWLVWYNYSQTSRTTVTAAGKLITQVNEKILERLSQIMDPVYVLAELIPASPEIYAPVVGEENHPATPILIQTLESYPRLYGVYMGYDDGIFYEVVRFNDLPDVRARLGAPDEAYFGVYRVMRAEGEEPWSLWTFLDAQRRLIGQGERQPATYDPRIRPWYKQAINSDIPVNSGLYLYHHRKIIGLTISKKFDRAGRTGVFGLDLPMSELSRFLDNQEFTPSSRSFFFNGDGIVTAYPDPQAAIHPVLGKDGKGGSALGSVNDLNVPMIDELYLRFKDGLRNGQAMVEVGGEEFIGTISPVPERYGKGDYLASIAPVSEFLGPLASVRSRSLTVSIISSLLCLPIIFWLARSFSESLQRLVKETVRIRHFQLEDPFHFESRITELCQLGDSVVTMKNALRIFGQYVPKDLVRRLIDTEEDVRLGGQGREVTLFFSDVTNFTTLSEDLPPKDLMLKLTTYFQVVGAAVQENGGTIDKYIGDAVMAFWNAPIPTPDHVHQACMAALDFAHRSNALNERWTSFGWPIMYTRVGLHTGDVVVGNVGSSDRMDYTAIGANVNLASRVEGLNKYYGTQILVTGAVRERVGERFLFRSVDLVVPKGASHTTAIYELIGTVGGASSHLTATPEEISWCERWESAIEGFRSRRWSEAVEAFSAFCTERPGDQLSEMYLERATQFQENPPPEGWNGARVYQSK
ncbi:MAG: hypothetical protein HQL52_15860 [Magnetococcales bacterium]|nr:hypothetical protein [Magnetococcales bacterium]